MLEDNGNSSESSPAVGQLKPSDKVVRSLEDTGMDEERGWGATVSLPTSQEPLEKSVG